MVDLKDIVSLPEGKTLEFKRDLSSMKPILKTLIADSVYPPLMPEIETTSLEGKALIVVRVAHWRGPFYLKA